MTNTFFLKRWSELALFGCVLVLNDHSRFKFSFSLNFHEQFNLYLQLHIWRIEPFKVYLSLLRLLCEYKVIIIQLYMSLNITDSKPQEHWLCIQLTLNLSSSQFPYKLIILKIHHNSRKVHHGGYICINTYIWEIWIEIDYITWIIQSSMRFDPGYILVPSRRFMSMHITFLYNNLSLFFIITKHSWLLK